jgi:CheY-like chemotaxis protein
VTREIVKEGCRDMSQASQEAGAAPPASPNRVVVVVDDALLLREVYAGYLEEHGFTVALAADGVEALLQIKRLRPLGVVIDLLMPRVNGLELLAEIRAIDPAMRLVVVTGARATTFREQAVALGADVFLEKPVSRETLVSALTAPGS